MSEENFSMEAGQSTTPTPEYVGSQTVGPYYAIGLDYLVSEQLAPEAMPGPHVTITGSVFDADGEPVPDAILELWQASPAGEYATAAVTIPGREPNGFSGFARLSTHDGGRFRVQTVVPGAVPYLDGRPQAPHIVVLVYMRGLMRHLVTRMYFPDADAVANDPVLALVPEERRSTLIAQPAGESGMELRWDVHMQGDQETVFFAC